MSQASSSNCSIHTAVSRPHFFNESTARRSGHLGVEAATAAAAAPGTEDVNEITQLGFLTLVDLLHGLWVKSPVSLW